jgi:hypothetical protein
MRLLLAAIAVLPIAASVPACSSSSSATNACKAYVVPADFNATTPTVSFKTDVAAIFPGSCAFTSCHGSETGSNQANLYLGSDTARVYTGLVGVMSTKYPSMARVKASDATNSYLMHKIDGDSCTLPSCNGDCANTMPADEPVDSANLLAVDKRDTVRRWILQGAQNN